MVKTPHSLACLPKPPGAGNSTPRLPLELSCADYGRKVEIPKKPLLIALDITGTTSANWNGERRVHP